MSMVKDVGSMIQFVPLIKSELDEKSIDLMFVVFE